MALYGAPVWWTGGLLTACQRVMAIRFIRGYRTISGEAANLLAGMPPWDLEAQALADVHWWREAALRRGETRLPRQVAARQTALRRDLLAA